MSQTEIDMKTIQEKIKQLEKNLEKLNVSSSLEFSCSLDQLEVVFKFHQTLEDIDGLICSLNSVYQQ